MPIDTNDDFWSEVIGGISLTAEEGHPADMSVADVSFVREATVLDLVLQGDHVMHGKAFGGGAFTSMQKLTDKGKEASGLPTPQVAGTRVRFVANIGSVLSYDDVPGEDVAGTVITVKTAMGPCTGMDGRIFVSWDDGKFRAIAGEHLRLAGPSKKHAQNVRMVVSNLGDISSFFNVVASRQDELVHKATKDLWSFKKNGDNYVIERLFNDEGKPLKV